MAKPKPVPKALAIIVVIILAAAVLYFYHGKFVPTPLTPEQSLSAVSASVSSGGSAIKKGAVSASASSAQPSINVTSWPTFEMKYSNAGNENNLVVKAEYSLTAQGGKIYVPVNWAAISIQNTLNQGYYPKTIENKALDPVSVVNCDWGATCYEIPKGKTIRFQVRQVYNPEVMFGGLYSGRLDYLYFTTVNNTTGWFYYKQFPSQTSKLNTITIVGEKSPYLYTTNVSISNGRQFTLKGIRLTGATAVITGGSNVSLSTWSQTDDGIVLSATGTPGVYTVYLNHPTYGASNKAQIFIDALTLLSPNGGEVWPKGSQQAIKWDFVDTCGGYEWCTSQKEAVNIMVIGKAYEANIATVSLAQKYFTWNVGTTLNSSVPAGGPYELRICRANNVCDSSNGTFTIK